MEHRESWGAVLFLAALALGALLLCTGLWDRGPERSGFRFPHRTDYAAHLRTDQRRASPRRRGQARPVDREPLSKTVRDLVSSAEPAANALLDRDHLFIQLYGGVQRLSGREVLEDADPRYTVVRLSDGTLTFVNPEPLDVTGHGLALARLRDQLAKRDTPLLYVQAPQKLRPEDPRLPEGVADHGNDYADQLLSVLEEHEAASLDLRAYFESLESDWSSWFFATDHHWTPEAGFHAAAAIADWLRGEGFSIPAAYTDPGRFARYVYRDWFLGSQGKRTGTLYGGVDDVELWIPDFETAFTYSVPIYEIERAGPFETSLLFPERVEERDYFNGNPYTLYAGGDYPLARVYNDRHPEGPRVMLLRDSYACTATPFLALGCGELITVDLRYFHDDLMTYVDWLEPDAVVVLYTAGSVALEELFDFFRAAPAPEGRWGGAPPAAEKPPLDTSQILHGK